MSLYIDGQAIEQIDPRFDMQLNHVTTHPAQFSMSMAHDMRIGIAADLSSRPNLKPSYRKRVNTAEGHFEELIDFMDHDEHFSRIKDRFNEQNGNPYDSDDENWDPDFQWGWHHSTLWEELKVGSDPDPFGAQMAAMGRYLVFYRHWHHVNNEEEGSRVKYNNSLPAAQSHSLPYLYRFRTSTASFMARISVGTTALAMSRRD